MSGNRQFQTTALKKGQVVKVRTRYAITFDGNVTETAWKRRQYLFCPYLRMHPTDILIPLKSVQQKISWFCIAGKIENNKSMLLFLDTKPGGFNLSDYGDEAISTPSVRGFNYFNNNPSTFDSYFQADYCLVIAKEDTRTNYFADIIELKQEFSTKINLGNVSTGFLLQ
jgi:hypothetical protein